MAKDKKTTKQLKNKGSKHNTLKAQIERLGGTDEDFDLVNGSDDLSGAGEASVVDPKLAQDVSKFLNELQNTAGPSQKSSLSTKRNKGKAREESPPASTSEKFKTNAAKGSSSLKPSSATDPSKVASFSKVQPASKAKRPKKDARAENLTSEKIPQSSLISASAAADSVPEPTAAQPKRLAGNSKSRFVVPPRSQWYTALPPLKHQATSAPTASQISSLSQKAASLHASDVSLFQSSSSSSTSETSFLSKMIQSGTLSDRLSALTLLVQSSPLHNPKALEMLKGMAERGKGKGGREESLKALRCIVDWWVGGGVPDRKLKYFRDQPLTHPDVTDVHLVVWHFEDWLKKYFFSVLQILETLSLDPLPYVRTQSLRLVATLLKDKPEQEQNLLRLLVNKLGDTEKSLCSRASHHILQVLQAHPAMKMVVVTEIINLIFKPASSLSAAATSAGAGSVDSRRIKFGQSNSKDKGKGKPATGSVTANTHARYYAAITFNQIVLSPADKEVALKLIDVYFELFKEILGSPPSPTKDPEDGDGEEGEELQKDKKGRVLQKKQKRKGKDKETKGAAGFAEVENQHSKLVSAILTGVNRAVPFAKTTGALSNHIDTLFLITHKSTFNVSVQALLLLQQISLSTPSSSSSDSTTADRYYRSLYSSLLDPRLASSNKQAMYLNLFFKSVKSDPQADPHTRSERQKALVRRFVQVLVSGAGMAGANEFVVGGLYVLGELFGSVPGLRAWLRSGGESGEGDEGEGQKGGYDPKKRDPRFANAGKEPLWELTPLLSHYHPTVSLHARQLLAGEPLTSSADLSLNTLSHFLDRFVYKNPKKSKSSEHGGSLMQSGAAGQGINGGVMKTRGEQVGDKPVNEEGWANRRIENVPADELFYHRFFTNKARRSNGGHGGEDESDEDQDAGSADGGPDSEQDEDDDEVGSGDEMDLTGDEAAQKEAESDDEKSESEDEEGSMDEDEIWKAIKASMPEADDGLSDLDDSDEDEEGDIDLDDEDDEALAALADGMISSEEEERGEDANDEEDDDGSDEEDFALAEDSDDLLPLNADGLIEYDGSDHSGSGDSDEEEWGGLDTGGATSKKRKHTTEQGKTSKKKARRSLPTFASYEDYAKMIEDGPEDDI